MEKVNVKRTWTKFDIKKSRWYDQTCAKLYKAINEKNKEAARLILQDPNFEFKERQVKSWTLVVAAIKNFEDSEITELCLNKKAYINKGTRKRPCPLVVAVQLQKIETVKLLLSRGALIGVEFTSLINQAYQLDNYTLIEILAEHGVKQNKTLKGKFNLCVYQSVEHGYKALFENLIKLNVSVNMMCKQTGLALIHIALIKKHMDIVEVLVKNKADINVQINAKEISKHGKRFLRTNKLRHGLTPLYIAAVQLADPDVVKLFLDNGASIETDPNSFIIISTALKQERKDILKHIENSCSKFSNPNSSFDFDTDTVTWLLKNGADINAENDDKETVLFYFIRNCNIKMVEVCLEHGADVQHQNIKGDTPLHVACRVFIDSKLVKILLDHDARTNVTNINGLTPLHFACDQGYLDKVEMLLEHNAGVNVADKYGKTPLHVMCGRGEIWVIEVIKTMINYTGDIDVRDLKGRTPLFEACEVGNIGVINILLEKNANMEVANYQGDTPLHIAIRKFSKNLEFIRLLLDSKLKNLSVDSEKSMLHFLAEYNLDVLDFLSSKKIDVNSVDEKGRTALHIAADKGHVDVVENLLKHRADINVMDVENQTAFHYALRRIKYFREELKDHRDIVEFRRNHSIRDCGYHNDYYHYGREKIDYFKREINLYKKIRNIFKEHIIKLKCLGLFVEKCNYDLVYNNDNNGDEECDNFSDDEDENIYDINPDILHDDSSHNSDDDSLNEFKYKDEKPFINDLSMHGNFSILGSSTPKREIDHSQIDDDSQYHFKRRKI